MPMGALGGAGACPADREHAGGERGRVEPVDQLRQMHPVADVRRVLDDDVRQGGLLDIVNMLSKNRYHVNGVAYAGRGGAPAGDQR